MRAERRGFLVLARACACATALALLTWGRAGSAATVTINNLDAAGVGFNDATPAAPVGGNPGTTRGQQRLNAFQYAANLWGARLTSTVPIVVDGNFGSLTPCTPTGGVIGQAGPTNGFWFGTAYPPYVPSGALVSSAEADKLAGVNQAPGTADISASFNSNIGTAGCLTSLSWYLGFDALPGASQIDFVSVLLHELAHGLGYLSWVNNATGAEAAAGHPDVFELNLFDNGTGVAWSAMTNAQRATSAINTNHVVWSGPNTTALAATAVTTGKDASNRVLLFTPNPLQSGSSVSHWTQGVSLPNPCPTCTDLTPIDLMKPAYTLPTHNTLITHKALEDMGWGAVAAPVHVQSFVVE